MKIELLIFGLIFLAIGIAILILKNRLAGLIPPFFVERWWVAREGLDWTVLAPMKFLISGIVSVLFGVIFVTAFFFQGLTGELSGSGSLLIGILIFAVFVAMILYFFAVNRTARR